MQKGQRAAVVRAMAGKALAAKAGAEKDGAKEKGRKVEVKASMDWISWDQNRGAEMMNGEAMDHGVATHGEVKRLMKGQATSDRWLYWPKRHRLSSRIPLMPSITTTLSPYPLLT